MRPSYLVALLQVVVVADAAAMSIDPKAMARFDNSFAKCEAKFAEMRGGRDEAYLSLWRVKSDDKARAELAAIRKGASYQEEIKRIKQAEAKAAPDNAALDGQCRALWGETQRVRSIAK